MRKENFRSDDIGEQPTGSAGMLTRRVLAKLSGAQAAAAGVLVGCGRSGAPGPAAKTALDALLDHPVTALDLDRKADAIAWHPDGKSLVVTMPRQIAKYTFDGHKVWQKPKPELHGAKQLCFDETGTIIFTSPFTKQIEHEAGPCVAMVSSQTGDVLRELHGIQQPAGLQQASVFVMNKARDRLFAINSAYPNGFLLEYGAPDWKLRNVAGPLEGIDWIMLGIDWLDRKLFMGRQDATLLVPARTGYLNELDSGSGKLIGTHRITNAGLGPLVVLQDQTSAIVTLSGGLQGTLSRGPDGHYTSAAGDPDPASYFTGGASTAWKVDIRSGTILGTYDTTWPAESVTSCAKTGVVVVATTLLGRGTRLYVLDMNAVRILDQARTHWSSGVVVSLSDDGGMLALAQYNRLSIYNFEQYRSA